jgi:hypothetical protein
MSDHAIYDMCVRVAAKAVIIATNITNTSVLFGMFVEFVMCHVQCVL